MRERDRVRGHPKSMSTHFARLLHPAFILALAVLLLNDHVLKEAFASPITGKLSDVAGLIVLPVLLTTLPRILSHQLVWAVHGTVGLVFAAVQFVPESALWAVGLAVQHTPDPTDLIALAVLPFGVRLSLAEFRQRNVHFHPALSHAVGLVAVGAVLATSPPPSPLVVEPTPVFTAITPPEAIDQLEERLVALGLEVYGGLPPAYRTWVATHPTYEDGEDARQAYDELVGQIQDQRTRGQVAYRLHLPAEACTEALPKDGFEIDLSTEWDANASVLAVSVSGVDAEGLRWRFADEAEQDHARQLVQTCLIGPLLASG